MNDADSDLDSTSIDFSTPIQSQPSHRYPQNNTQTAVVSRSLFQLDDDGDNDNDDDTQEHVQREEQVLTDAMLAMVNSITSMSADAITSGLVYTVELLTPYIMGSGALVATSAASIAGFGMMWSSAQQRSSSGTLSRLSWMPSHRALWTTAFIGGLSAGGIFLVRSGVRNLFVKASPAKGKKPATKKSNK